MTAAIVTAAVAYVVIITTALAICADSKARDIDAAMRRHPSWSDDTEQAIVQAVGILDDGKALVGEVEDYLRGLSR